MKVLAPALLVALVACSGQQSSVENTADQLEEAAEQSDPAAAEVLENAADEVRDQNSIAPADQALENAASASMPPPERQGTMPPPKVPSD
jgi:N-acetylglucosamine kinase-like BadF-type ATPase